MRIRGPAEAASQAALVGLACCFQERCQVRLRCPARWGRPDPATLAGRAGKYLHTPSTQHSLPFLWSGFILPLSGKSCLLSTLNPSATFYNQGPTPGSR